jgi:hypothetical protein
VSRGERSHEAAERWIHVAPRARREGVGGLHALDPSSKGRRKRVRITGDSGLLERRFEALAKPG